LYGSSLKVWETHPRLDTSARAARLVAPTLAAPFAAGVREVIPRRITTRRRRARSCREYSVGSPYSRFSQQERSTPGNSRSERRGTVRCYILCGAYNATKGHPSMRSKRLKRQRENGRQDKVQELPKKTWDFRLESLLKITTCTRSAHRQTSKPQFCSAIFVLSDKNC
jgi:hypothetical protein